jgi:hypothetical protein
MSRFDRTSFVTFAAHAPRWAARRFPRALAGSVVAATALLFAGSGAMAAPAGAPSGPTPQQLAAMSPAQQNDVLHPLNILADAFGTVGRTSETSLFAGLELDARAGTVNLYLVDTRQSARFITEAVRQDRTIDVSRVRVRPANHSKQQLDAATDRVLAAGAPAGYQIASVTVPPDGSGLQVGLAAVQAPGAAVLAPIPAADLAAGGQQLATTVGVPVTALVGQMGTLSSRFADGKPYIAGERITSGGFGCTSGVPAVGNSGGVYMVTAAHCAHTGARIGDGNGTFMGNVVNFNTHWDTAIYYVGSNAVRDDNADEFDGSPSTTHFLPLRGTQYSFNGQSVCQDGDTSGVVCGITVANQDTTQCFGPERYAGFCARGVLGNHNGTAVRPGDSGGLVFCVCEGTAAWRQVRGNVTGWVGNDSHMFWTESLDTYGAFGIHLNPNH